MTERWLPVPGFEGRYEVSDQGRVRSLPRVVATRRRGQTVTHIPGRILKGSLSSYRYLEVRLHKDGVATVRRVHRLVLEAFVGPCPEGMEGCHNDDNTLNNQLPNLRWDTHAENNRDQVRRGRHRYSNKTECIRGHALTPENTELRDGVRRCLECTRKRNRERMRAYRAAQKESA